MDILEAMSGALCPVWAFQNQERCWVEAGACNVLADNQWACCQPLPKGIREKAIGARVALEVYSKRRSSDGCKCHQGECSLETGEGEGEISSQVRVVCYWNRFLREIVGFLCLKILKTWPDKTMRNLITFWRSLWFEQEVRLIGLQRAILLASIILQFCLSW